MDMSANFLVFTQDGDVLQYYVSSKGNPQYLGELLRQKLLQSLGLLVLDPNKPLLDCFLNSIKDVTLVSNNFNFNSIDGMCTKEKESKFSDSITLHNDIEYIYIVNLNMHYPDLLYCTGINDYITNSKINKNLIDVVCVKENVIPLSDTVKE